MLRHGLQMHFSGFFQGHSMENNSRNVLIASQSNLGRLALLAESLLRDSADCLSQNLPIHKLVLGPFLVHHFL
jgi:hypothetical protein